MTSKKTYRCRIAGTKDDVTQVLTCTVQAADRAELTHELKHIWYDRCGIDTQITAISAMLVMPHNKAADHAINAINADFPAMVQRTRHTIA